MEHSPVRPRMKMLWRKTVQKPRSLSQCLMAKGNFESHQEAKKRPDHSHEHCIVIASGQHLL